ncbi:hypothetical protein [Cupriavidus agavae]|uniref:Uncharacterized protein n=1 Tax=Cupriavidus agavae TaxID=1001822 RepID=A0A4V2FH53_9BURK|nr:hypothetical protein [Cupriavidus agavae]RZT39079.1 hypothetical protein EV147_2273 [Cupriavidus agavae]
MRQPIIRSAFVVVSMLAGAAAWAQAGPTPKVDNRAPGTPASDVAPGAPATGVYKDGSRQRRESKPAVNQGASAAQTYDYPASAPKTAPAKRP